MNKKIQKAIKIIVDNNKNLKNRNANFDTFAMYNSPII